MCGGVHVGHVVVRVEADGIAGRGGIGRGGVRCGRGAKVEIRAVKVQLDGLLEVAVGQAQVLGGLVGLARRDGDEVEYVLVVHGGRREGAVRVVGQADYIPIRGRPSGAAVE